MRFDVLTLLPEFFSGPLKCGVTGRAVDRGLIKVNVHNIRDFTTDRHRTADDAPYGGGSGMVMKVEPVKRALEHVMGLEDTRPTVVLTTPQGEPFGHRAAVELSKLDRVVVICGRYEGVDERIRALADKEYSIGDYVLTGGEIAALVLIDAAGRLVQGVLGDEASSVDESFSKGLLEYPQYTRPEEFEGERVPEVLTSGDHAAIERWRRTESLRRTLLRRPELLDTADLTNEDRRILEGLKEKG